MDWKEVKKYWRKDNIPATDDTIEYLNNNLTAEQLRGGYVEKAEVIWYQDPVAAEDGTVDVETALLVKAFVHGDFGDEVEDGEELTPHWVEFRFSGPSYQGISDDWEEYDSGDDITCHIIHQWEYDNQTIGDLFDEYSFE